MYSFCFFVSVICIFSFIFYILFFQNVYIIIIIFIYIFFINLIFCLLFSFVFLFSFILFSCFCCSFAFLFQFCFLLYFCKKNFFFYNFPFSLIYSIMFLYIKKYVFGSFPYLFPFIIFHVFAVFVSFSYFYYIFFLFFNLFIFFIFYSYFIHSFFFLINILFLSLYFILLFLHLVLLSAFLSFFLSVSFCLGLVGWFCVWAELQVACQSAVSQEQVEGMLSENDALRTNLAALEQIQTVKTQELNLLREQNLALNAELQQRHTEQESFLAQKDDLNSQLQESNRANSRLLEQLTELGLEKDKLQQELEEARKTADKRKVMLDELAIEMAEEKSRHKEELSDVRLQHEKEVLSIRARYEKELRGLHEEKNRTEEEIRSQLRDERARTKELESLQPYVEELKAQVQSMEGTKGWFERRLKEAEVLCVYSHLSLQSIVRDGNFLTGIQKEREELNNTISKLKQEIKDTVDGQRILEKKGSSALKDLKRQLHLERKRADKLQERLQEILTNTKTRTGLEELVLSEINSPSRTQQTGDSSSISSFSYREIMKDGASAPSTNKSNTSSPQSQRPADLSDDEVSELFQRLAEVQQEKWMLEEKVKHLEVSCASMADDICKKTAIIETYVMDSRRGGAVAHGAQGERGGLSSVLRDLVKPGDENLREMNKKLQNMLEEQLTKNMHLQKVKTEGQPFGVGKTSFS
uniref:GRIP1 associated protein 1 n=1 Tax=Cyprinus carpio TaxID=7962 RepID=A0A8C2GTH9_CYPCA